MRRAAVLSTVVLAGALAPAGAAGGEEAGTSATRPVTKKVKVGDNFFSPRKLTVPKKSTIIWKWSSANGESHDVLAARRPKGVKRFQSAPAATDFSYKKKLVTPGKYLLVCTFHTEMTQTITVKR